jgi:hypothetical protein
MFFAAIPLATSALFAWLALECEAPPFYWASAFFACISAMFFVAQYLVDNRPQESTSSVDR